MLHIEIEPVWRFHMNSLDDVEADQAELFHVVAEAVGLTW